MSDENQSKKRGRPVGSNCFVRVSLADLNKFLRENASVAVSKKFLEEIGLTVQESSPIIAAQPDIGVAIPEFKITTFED
jgi:hypothetical protein